jgi:hypothetical protein
MKKGEGAVFQDNEECRGHRSINSDSPKPALPCAALRVCSLIAATWAACHHEQGRVCFGVG